MAPGARYGRSGESQLFGHGSGRSGNSIPQYTCIHIGWPIGADDVRPTEADTVTFDGPEASGTTEDDDTHVPGFLRVPESYIPGRFGPLLGDLKQYRDRDAILHYW